MDRRSGGRIKLLLWGRGRRIELLDPGSGWTIKLWMGAADEGSNLMFWAEKRGCGWRADPWMAAVVGNSARLPSLLPFLPLLASWLVSFSSSLPPRPLRLLRLPHRPVLPSGWLTGSFPVEVGIGAATGTSWFDGRPLAAPRGRVRGWRPLRRRWHCHNGAERARSLRPPLSTPSSPF